LSIFKNIIKLEFRNFKDKSLHIFLLGFTAIISLFVYIVLIRNAQTIDRINQQKLKAEFKAISSSLINKTVYAPASQKINDLEFITIRNDQIDNNNLLLVADSFIFGTNKLYLLNNQLYGKIEFRNDTNILYPLRKVTNLITSLTGKAVLINHQYNKHLTKKNFITLSTLTDLTGKEVGNVIVLGEKLHLNQTIYVATPILIFFLLLLLLVAKKVFQTKDKANTKLNSSQTINLNTIKDISFDEAVKGFSNGIRIIDKNFNVLYTNKAFEDLTSIKRGKANSCTCYETFGSIYCHTGECPVVSITSSEKEIVRNEIRFQPNGKKLHVELHAYPILNPNGEIIAIAEEIKDITNNYIIEEELRQSENQFKVFIDSLPFGVYIEDGVTNQIIFQNNYLKRLTKGKNFNDYLKEHQSNITDIHSDESEIQITDENGRLNTYAFHKFKFIGTQNKLKIGAILIDITRKKEVEHYRDVLSKAIEFTPISIIILSPHFEFEFINPNFTELTGYNIDTLYSKSILDVNLEIGSKNLIEQALNKVRAEENWQGEIQIRRKNGQKLWVSASFSPVINNKGELQQILAVFENITRRKEYEKELLFAKTKAEESDKLKSTFLNNISHEIRTPLNAIIGFTSFLSDESISAEERRGFSEYIYKNSQELLRIIENILEISQIETGSISISKREFSVNSLMNEIFREFDEIERGDSPIRLSLRKEIQHDDLIILSDPGRLKQVLKQLLSNSFKFTPNGFVEFGYRLKDEHNLMFYVIDSGIGIDQDKINYIFNPFRQADDSNTRQHGGLGLGLAISKHIVEKLGGKIWVNSLLGSGTSVFFTIPFIPVKMKFDNNTKTSFRAEFSWPGKTILIADDIDANFIYFKALLQKTNAKLIWAKNGLEAVNLVKSNQNIDLVLMDLVMPEVDGFEATRQIKLFRNDLPVLGQTAFPEKVNRNKLADYGFDTVLEKPIKPHQMLFIIDKFLEN